MYSEIQNKILTDKGFVLEEVDKIQQLYRLKSTIRYGQKREEDVRSESVGEHIFGMHILANYFLPLEDPKHEWDWQKIFQMITWHDVDEIISGDVIGYLKTEADRKREEEDKQIVLSELPELVKEEVITLLEEYDRRESVESKFVKAIDAQEPNFHLFNENGKQISLNKDTLLSQHSSIKDKHMSAFPYLMRFNQVLTAEMVEQGFFVPEA